MKGSSIFALFLFMVATILTVNYYDKFSDIEDVFSMLFWYFIVLLVVFPIAIKMIERNDND